MERPNAQRGGPRRFAARLDFVESAAAPTQRRAKWSKRCDTNLRICWRKNAQGGAALLRTAWNGAWLAAISASAANRAVTLSRFRWHDACDVFSTNVRIAEVPSRACIASGERWHVWHVVARTTAGISTHVFGCALSKQNDRLHLFRGSLEQSPEFFVASASSSLSFSRQTHLDTPSKMFPGRAIAPS